jgi:hypothetical protein
MQSPWLLNHMGKGVKYAAVVLAAAVPLGFSPAMTSSAAASTSAASWSAEEALSCSNFEEAQSAVGQQQASSALQEAARYAATAAQADPAWRPISGKMSFEASLPDAMLSAAQIASVQADSNAIQSACAAIGTPTYAAQQGRTATAANPLNSSTATAWTYFTGNTSLTAVQVAGLEGNLLYESGGALNPAVVQGTCKLPPGPCGVGIAQWTDPGSRFSSLQNLATTEGVAWQCHVDRRFRGRVRAAVAVTLRDS